MNPEHLWNNPSINRKARIEALNTRVYKTAETGHQSPTASEIEEAAQREGASQKVDWEAVRETERWIEEEWAAGRRAYDGPPGAYDILPRAVPKEVTQIGGVLLSRCAGYAVVPRPGEVVAAVKANTPTEREWYALKTYLLEATGVEVKTACQAGEINLGKLMRRVAEMIERDGRCELRGVQQWLTQ